MKKYIIFLLFIYVSLLNAQCPPDIFTFSSQNEIDNFSTNFPDCTSLEAITITGADITDVSGLSQIESVLSLSIINNPMLETINNLGSIEILNLLIRSNDMLTSIEGLSGITNTTSLFLNVSNNPLLTSLSPLSSLQGEVAFEVRNCDSLIDLSGFDNITSAPEIFIINNENLTDISALSTIIGSISDLSISGNPSLNNLEGLEGISAITGVIISIGDNDVLTSLNGFQPAMVSQLNIFDNDLLIDITSLESIEEITEIQIFNNPILSECSISSLCAFLQTEAGSFSTIENNAEGCNSIEEILDNCELGIVDTSISESIRIYPNPVDTILQIDTSTDIAIQKVGLFSINGNQIEVADHTGFMDVSTIAKGVYFLKIASDKGTIVKRFVKK